MDANTVANYAVFVVTVGGIAVAWHIARRAEVALAAWVQELRAWASEVIHVFAEVRAASALETDHDLEVVKSGIHRLSALTDRGRFYLPNQPRARDDSHKPLAYRGYRHAALDPLVAAIRVLDGTEKVDDSNEVLWELQRYFVSEIYRILRPDHQNLVIARMLASTQRSRKKDTYLGGLLPGGNIPLGATALLTHVRKQIAESRKRPPSTT